MMENGDKIKLLYVITKLELGGAQKQLLALIRGLDKERFITFLYTAKNGLLVEDALRIPCLKLKRSRFLERPIHPLKDFLAIIDLYIFIKMNRIDIVHTHSSKAGILGRLTARLAGVRVIVHTVHGWSFNDYQPLIKRKLFLWLEKIAAGFTDTLIVVSDYDKKRGLNNHIGKSYQYQLIRYGIDYPELDRVKGQNLKKELRMDPNNLLVGMISCFKPQKSPQDFIRLAYLVNQIIPEVKFILVGDGILRRDIEKLIDKFKLQNNVILTGWRRDIPDILSGIDIFVLTSLWEGLPISVLEAMGSKKPVVATTTGGIAEVIIENKTGYLVPPGDAKGMSERLAGLIKDENLRKVMGENAKKSLSINFRLENMVKQNQGLYQNLIKERGRAYDN